MNIHYWKRTLIFFLLKLTLDRLLTPSNWCASPDILNTKKQSSTGDFLSGYCCIWYHSAGQMHALLFVQNSIFTVGSSHTGLLLSFVFSFCNAVLQALLLWFLFCFEWNSWGKKRGTLWECGPSNCIHLPFLLLEQVDF